MKKTPILTAALGATLLIGALAGCTDNAKPSAGSPSSSSPKSSANGNSAKPGALTDKQSERLKQMEDASGKCIDGTSYIGASKTTFTLAEACDTVHVRGTGATIKLGAVNHLVIENTDNTITAASVKKIDNISSGNKVTYSGAKADITDIGSSSTFTNK